MTTELPADVTGRAAKLMRDRAEAAGSVPWRTAGADSCQCCLMIRDATGSLICTADDRQAPHIAGWHPLVAQAVADWLDKIAKDHTRDSDYGECRSCGEGSCGPHPLIEYCRECGDDWPCAWAAPALAVARAYLGEEAGS